MKLLTKELTAKLIANAKESAAARNGSVDHKPVVKLFTPDAGATWLLSELSDDGIAFGLCDLGLGEPELGYVSLAELAGVRGRFGLPVERDRFFRADKTMSEYTNAARMAGRITA